MEIVTEKSGISNNRSRRNDRRSPWVIGAVGSMGLAAFLSVTACESGSGSAAVNGTPYTFSTGPVAGSTSPEETPTTPISSMPDNVVPATPNSPNSQAGFPETAEWPAPEFNTLEVGAIKVGKTVAGKSYVVICRIPPNPGQPASVRKGGWYDVRDPSVGNGDVWVAANTFNNGQLPNDNPYDPNITALCPS